MDRSRRFTFENLAEGVCAAISRPGGGALSNSGLVDLQGEVLVFDTTLNPLAASELVSAAADRLGGPPTLAANSHWHLDHTLGNQVFSALPILGTRRTRDILLRDRRRLMEELRPASLLRDIRKLVRTRNRARSASARRYLDSVLRVHRSLLAVAGDLRWTPPNRTFVRRARLPGTRRAELLSFGAGHTASDAVLHLPHDGVLFGGDLIVVGTHPNLVSGDPEHWLTVLSKIAQLHPERIVPGHGPVASDDATADMSDYLTKILRLSESRGTPAIPSRFAHWTERGQFEENLRFLRSRAR